MKVSISLTTLALALSASAAPGTLKERDEVYTPDRCKEGSSTAGYMRDKFHPWIGQLVKPCTSPTDGKNIWSSRTCVTAAIAMGPAVLTDFAVCDKPDTLEETEQPTLDYSVYASIVGDCAYDAKACPITRQNLLDLIYSELDKASATIWPADASEVVTDVIGPVMEWATGDWSGTASYTRFNQWLHVSPYPSIIGDDEHTSGKTYYYNHESDHN
ncbi:unnamed protein product [Peniophora sp. CBMAI 1063]|nr:unnamed protein product [Peniophora sp. CBMAI 1063]